MILPFASLSGCSGDKEPAPAATPPAESTAPEATADPQPAETSTPVPEAPAAEGLPILAEDDPQAVSLGYVHEATNVDTAKYPRYEAGQACSNCALFQAAEGEWGGCSIFPGKQVNAAGWCNVYAPKG